MAHCPGELVLEPRFLGLTLVPYLWAMERASLAWFLGLTLVPYLW
eukprot:CAMPEP_0185807304 /NCGR_PEP_ID=MMETSP1322-20130828/4938_1 /TAXON_ID=265543 /ORGANISM="Minutocellus polymorphus, Strain RCC2270" /LENGTH=44 /DNA_ID= /DNA_START= /DNA_END= /DNA_ORIENTATION=